MLNSLSIPNLVVPPLWTALTMEATDEGGLSIRGPKLAGRARTDEGPSWFGNCLETAVVKTEKDERQFRLYLSEYTDETGVRHLCKHRAAPGTMPPWLEDPPIAGNEAETAFTGFNLGVFVQLLDKARESTMATLDRKYPDAPGVAEGWVEVGEGASAATPTAAPTPSAPVGGVTGSPTPAPPVGPAAPPAPKAPPAKPGVAVKTKPAPAKPAAKPVPMVKPGMVQPFTSTRQAVGIPKPPQTAVQAAPSAPIAALTVAASTTVAPRVWAPPGSRRPPAAGPRLRPASPKP